MWEASASDHSIDIPQAFRVGLFFEAIRRRQEMAVDLLRTLCRDVLEDWVRVDDITLSKNLRLTYIEAQGVSHFIEWK